MESLRVRLLPDSELHTYCVAFCGELTPQVSGCSVVTVKTVNSPCQSAKTREMVLDSTVLTTAS